MGPSDRRSMNAAGLSLFYPRIAAGVKPHEAL
jgi:hypothetical protein